jgi:hypothetical protein
MEGVARRGCPQDIAHQLRKLEGGTGKQQTVGERLDADLDELNRQYRCEYVYKAAIASRIVFGRHSPSTASLAIELNVAGSIVDCAVFNGTSTVYEIKTQGLDLTGGASLQRSVVARHADALHIDPRSVRDRSCGTWYSAARLFLCKKRELVEGTRHLCARR